MADNIVLYMDKCTPGMEQVMLDVCPPELDMRFYQPSGDVKKGEIADANFIFATVYPVTREIIYEAKNLKGVMMPGAGFNHIDINAAAERGVFVTNAANQNTSTTAELTIGLMIDCLRHVCDVDNRVKHGEWHTFTYRHDSYEIRGKTIGVVGGGACGREVMKRLIGWDCSVLYYDLYRLPEEKEKELNATYADLDTLLEKSDIVSLHVPLNSATRGMINKNALNRMKKNAIIVNEARGAVINNEDLAEALANKKIWGAAIDCWEKEPLDPSDPLVSLDNVITTSHLGGSTREAMERCWGVCYANAMKILGNDRPINIVNGL